MSGARFVVAILVVLAAGKASANTDINGLFDARSSALGATGVAYLDSAGAIPVNPAALDQIGKMAFTAQGIVLITQPQSPYTITHSDGAGQTYQNYETIRFDRVVAPLFFLGGAYRVLDRVVVGAAVYPMIGMGTTTAYRPAPELMPRLELQTQVAAGLLEVGVPVSVRVLDNLSVALMWRATYFQQSASQPVPGQGLGGTILDTTGKPIYADLDVSGWNFGGLEVGVLYKALPNLRFGLTYRSKVTVNGTGTTTSRNPLDGSSLELDTKQAFTNPHGFRGGVALTTLQDRLMFAADFKYLMYAEAYKSIDTTVIMDGKPMTNSTTVNWKDAYSIHLGAEYHATEVLWLRAGYSLVTSATPKAYAKAYMAPPGVSHALSAGLGVRVLDHLNLDVAGTYIIYQTDVETATRENAGIGTYGSNTGQLALSATYRM